MGAGGKRGKHAFFSSILFFEHVHFLLLFSLLFSCFHSSKKYCNFSLDAPITMKINKKETRNEECMNNCLTMGVSTLQITFVVRGTKEFHKVLPSMESFLVLDFVIPFLCYFQCHPN
jgi:hypothetical protein